MRNLSVMLALGLCVLTAKAEDWTTTDGRIYKDVKIVKHDVVNVTIMDSDGGAEVPLASLPADLQRKFGYDPAKTAAFAKEQAAKELDFRRQVDELQRKGVAQLKELISSALSSSTNSAILYSIEPEVIPQPEDKTLHHFKILGQMSLDPTQTQLAAKAFQKAAEEWGGTSAACFNPRHALKISSGGHTYDFVLCYECGEVDFYKDDKAIGSAGASGSPEFLNGLLLAAHVPLPPTGEESPDVAAAERKKQNEDEARWFAAMPKSVQPIWDWAKARGSPTIPDVSLVRGLVSREFPEDKPRILKLLEWYGSGAGPWNGVAEYEELPCMLLFDYSTGTILDAVQSTKLNDAQIEGTARFFGGWDFSQHRPKDLALLPASLKQALLAHSLKSNDSDKIDRAKSAFR